jgi:putative flavoprotein involved in K+ transport
VAEFVDVVVVGAGQAGLAVSRHLSSYGIGHVVLERHRIAERWRSERWDSLVANGPAWHDRFADFEFPCGPEVFAGKEDVAAYFVAYAEHIEAPVRCGIDVRTVRRIDGRGLFAVDTSDGVIECSSVVAATGAFQQPIIPPLIPANAPVTQLHSSAYRNAEQLPPGGVLVVGAGSSGSQIADDLRRAGRQVYLSVGSHGRPPRRYRGRDFVWWLGVLNKWDAETQPGSQHTTIAVSGVDGGRTVDFRRLADEGVTLLGSVHEWADGAVLLADDLARNLARGDADYLALLDEADQFVARTGIELPEEPEARIMGSDPQCVTSPIRTLHLAQTHVTSVVWATGFTVDFSWLQCAASDADGKPVHTRGVSAEPGVYFVGLPWQTRRGSSFIWGVWHDARYIADHIAKQQAYAAYQPPAD